MRYEPAPDEVVVVRLAPGEEAWVATIEGELRIYGETPGEHAESVAAHVPFDPNRVWKPSRGGPTLVRSMTTNVLDLHRGKHRNDWPIWKAASHLLKSHGAVVVTVRPVPYYGRERMTAVGVRVA